VQIRFIILFLLFSVSGYSQNPEVEATVSATSVTVGEIFTYQITANQDCEISIPEFGDLEIVSGPSQGVSEGTSIVNGVSKSYKYYSFTYKLRAPKKGTYAIPPVSMKCKLKKVNSETTITIKTIDGGTSTQQESKSNFSFKISADKSSVYVGEPFVLTFRFYSTKKPSQIEAITQGTASGLWRKDLNPNRTSFNMTQENVKGVRYYVLELSTEVCIPVRAGKITIEPYASSLIHAIDIFNNEREEGKSNSLTIDVKKLPGEAPADFNGLVGNFDLSFQVDKTSLIQGQSLELSLKISGVGNFNAFDEPKLTLPKSFTISEQDPLDETTITERGLDGSITYTYILSADEPGDFEIAPFSFSYFNLAEKQYKQLTTEKFSLHVEKGDENHGAIYKGQKPVEIENTDIQFIHQEEGVSFSLNEFIFGSLPYMTLLIGPPILLLLVLFLRRKKNNVSEEDKTENNKKQARKMAQKNLAKALQQLKSGQEKEALKTLQSSLISYLMIKLNLSLSSLSIKAITVELETRKADTNVILNLSNVWKKIEMAQYAPITAQNLEDTIRDTQKLIDELDAKI
jgi:hypothetical protein